MAEVVTRKGIFHTLIKNHFICAVVTLVLVLTAFKWMYSMETGNTVLFLVAAGICYGCGVYSYTYYQAKVDMRDKKRYDWLMPAKIAAAEAVVIIVPALVHILLVAVVPPAGELFGYFARLWNYPFFSLFYGPEGKDYLYMNMGIAAVASFPIAYLAYFLGIKRFSFLEKLNKVIYKKD